MKGNKLFAPFEEIVENRHEHIKGLKTSEGKKVIGYLCSYAPEELIYAAGIIPVRIFSNEEPPSYGDSIIHSHYCAFARSILHQGLKGDFDYLDGLVWAYTCNTIRFTYEAWEMHGSLPFTRYLYLPTIIDTPEAKDYYVGELRRLRKDLEDLTGREISDQDLGRAIEVYDTNRALLSELMELRKSDQPPLWGKEAYQVTISSMLTDKAYHNELLRNLIDQLSHRSDLPDASTRLMIVGSPVDNLVLLDVLEENTRGIVVTDDTCTGSRYYRGATPIASNDDPLEAIAERYLISRAPCPQKYSPTRWTQCTTCPYREIPCFMVTPKPRSDVPEHLIFEAPGRICRFKNLLQLANSNNVQGAIIVQQNFCDCHGLDHPHVAQLFKSINVPSFFLEVENLIPVGQLKIRVQAFIEMIEPEDLWEEVV